MPRRDGNPTNQEMLVDFTTMSRDLFVTAFEAQMQGDLPPAFKDKPLSYLGFEVMKRYLPSERTSDGVSDEELTVAPLTQTNVDDMKEHLKMREFPADIFEYYKKIASLIGRTALTDTTRLRGMLPPNGVIATYTAVFPNERRLYVDTLKEKPTKRTIVAAQYLATEAANYITSGQFEKPIEEKLRDAIRGDTDGVIRHHFTLQMTPNLPLNGHENLSFLRQYRDKMLAGLQAKQRHLEFLKQHNAPEVSLTNTIAQIDLYETALARVTEILDK